MAVVFVFCPRQVCGAVCQKNKNSQNCGCDCCYSVPGGLRLWCCGHVHHVAQVLWACQTCASCGTSAVGMSDMCIMWHKCMIMLGGDLFLLFIGEERTNMVTPWGAQICSQNKNEKRVYVLKEQPYRSCKWNCLHTVCFGFWNTFRHEVFLGELVPMPEVPL